MVYYDDEKGVWDSLQVKLRKRGNFRLNNCYFVPLKIKIKKSVAKTTLFEGNKKMKMVLPCLREKSANDDIVEEYLAYKIYEHISPYHFKTRFFEADITEKKGKKDKTHQVKGFFIEDLDKIVERFSCNELKREVHPLQQEEHCSTRNAFFQFMIGNTDFSTGLQHNEKLIFVEGHAIPIPYDFDMSGLVNASYSRVSQIGDTKLPITQVRDRLYRGFKRDPLVFETVRREYLKKKEAIIQTVQAAEQWFEDPGSHASAQAYIIEFFSILSNEFKFNEQIVGAARIK